MEKNTSRTVGLINDKTLHTVVYPLEWLLAPHSPERAADQRRSSHVVEWE